MSSPRTRRRRSGQGLVELALALPVLLLILLGTVDLGRMFFDYTEIRNAAREGAGVGARNPANVAGAVAAVNAHGIPNGSTVTTGCSGNCTEVNGTGIFEVTVSYTFTPVATGFLATYFGIGAVPLQAKAAMRVMS